MSDLPNVWANSRLMKDKLGHFYMYRNKEYRTGLDTEYTPATPVREREEKLAARVKELKAEIDRLNSTIEVADEFIDAEDYGLARITLQTAKEGHTP